jgi:hypothetical protein
MAKPIVYQRLFISSASVGSYWKLLCHTAEKLLTQLGVGAAKAQ